MKGKSSINPSMAMKSQNKNSKEKFYKLEFIFDKRWKKGGKNVEYLVKWDQYSTLLSTWEPEKHLEGCEHFIDEFEASSASKTCIGELPSDFEDDDINLFDTPSIPFMPTDFKAEKAETKVLKKRASNSSQQSGSEEPLKKKKEKKEKKDEEKVQVKEKPKQPMGSKINIRSFKNTELQQEIVPSTNVNSIKVPNLNKSENNKSKSESKMKPEQEPEPEPEPESKKENKVKVVVEEKKTQVPVPDLKRNIIVQRKKKPRKTFNEAMEKLKKMAGYEEKKKDKVEVKAPVEVVLPTPVLAPVTASIPTAVDEAPKPNTSNKKEKKKSKNDELPWRPRTRVQRKLHSGESWVPIFL